MIGRGIGIASADEVSIADDIHVFKASGEL